MSILRQYIKDRGLTEIEAAKLLGVRQPSVNQWLNGAAIPSARHIVQLARVTGRTIFEIFDAIGIDTSDLPDRVTSENIQPMTQEEIEQASRDAAKREAQALVERLGEVIDKL